MVKALQVIDGRGQCWIVNGQGIFGAVKESNTKI